MREMKDDKKINIVELLAYMRRSDALLGTAIHSPKIWQPVSLPHV